MIIQLVLFATLVYLAPGIYKFLANYYRYKKMTASIPGWEGHPILGNVTDLTMSSEAIPRISLKMAREKREAGVEKFFKIYIFHHLAFTPWNGEMAKYILDSTEEITKGNDYDIFEPWLGKGLLTSTGGKWRTRRKMLTPTFHFTMLDGYIQTMNRHAKMFCALLEDKVGYEFDLYPGIKLCTLDIICETAMGKDLGSQTEPDQPYVAAISELMAMGIQISINPPLWVDWIQRLCGIKQRFDDAVKVAHNFTTTMIGERVELLSKGEVEPNKRAFIDLLLEQREKQRLSMEDIREEVDTFILRFTLDGIIGHDTTASAIGWTMWSLACHPEIQERAYQEIRSVFGDSMEMECDRDEMSRLVYLERCIKESMRLFPPVPFAIRELKNDMVMGDHLLPRGANVIIAPYIIHRNEQIYEDCDKFDPDRFLPENVAKRHPYDYIPFSAGLRNCIGQKFALFEEKIIVSWLLRHYKFHCSRTFDKNPRLSEVVLKAGRGIQLIIDKR